MRSTFLLTKSNYSQATNSLLWVVQNKTAPGQIVCKTSPSFLKPIKSHANPTQFKPFGSCNNALTVTQKPFGCDVVACLVVLFSHNMRLRSWQSVKKTRHASLCEFRVNRSERRTAISFALPPKHALRLGALVHLVAQLLRCRIYSCDTESAVLWYSHVRECAHMCLGIKQVHLLARRR